MALALDVGQPTDALGEVGRSRAIETIVRQNAKTKRYLLWHSQQVEILEEQGDVFRTPRRVHESGGSIEDRLKSVEKITRDAGQY